MITIAFGVLIASLTAAPAAQPALATPGVDLKGKLYRSVFFSGPGGLTAGDVVSLPPQVRVRLQRYLSRRAAFKSGFTGAADSFESAAGDAKRRVVERAIVALDDDSGIEKAAADYVQRATILHEWETDASAPLEEAAYAEDFLKQNTSSPLAPYLYVFIAARQRAAFELLVAGKDQERMKAAARKYRTFMQRARTAADPIFGLLADDLDRQPYVYSRSGQHPRDFDPDA
jgi:hypothetical protein